MTVILNHRPLSERWRDDTVRVVKPLTEAQQEQVSAIQYFFRSLTVAREQRAVLEQRERHYHAR